jgi:hypothetical protein
MLIVILVAELSVNPEMNDTRQMEASRDTAMYGSMIPTKGNERSE